MNTEIYFDIFVKIKIGGEPGLCESARMMRGMMAVYQEEARQSGCNRNESQVDKAGLATKLESTIPRKAKGYNSAARLAGQYERDRSVKVS